MNGSSLLDLADDILIGAGIAFLIVRQFMWRAADPARLLLMPVIIVIYGIGSVTWDILHGERLKIVDLVVFIVELALVGCTGTVMGVRTRFRRRGQALQYKLDAWGVALWAIFIAIRIGSFLLAAQLDAHALETTGAILISFGANRLASSITVRRRVKALERANIRPEVSGAKVGG